MIAPRGGFVRLVHVGLALVACAESLRAGIDPKNFDSSIKPLEDFYQYADGGWLKANPIPPEYSSWSAFHEVNERNQAALHVILDRAAAAKKPGAIEQKVADFYTSGMNLAAVDAAGVAPLQAELDRVAAVKTREDCQAILARMHRFGIGAGFFIASEQDPKESTMMIGGVGQAGLGLPDRDYYFREDEKSKTLRDQYVAHVAKMLVLAGDKAELAKEEAAAVMKLETALAKGSKTNVQLRDPVANYHKLPLAEVQKLTPHFEWTAFLKSVDAPTVEALDIGQPEFLQALDEQLASAPIADWQAYFRWHWISAFADYLSQPFVDEEFAFYGKTLTGAQQLKDRWKRVLETIDGSIGEALGQLYVAEYFPPDSKARMLDLVGNLRTALRERLQSLEWMDEPTRAKALAKLDAFGVKIGYPDKWIDYSKLVIDRESYAGNVMRAREFNVHRDLAKIGKPVDRLEWGMTPPTVNAYYNPTMNEIVFPAGILQPPFFDAKADDAVNYGGIGAVIGHEMTHGFDDQGRQFDAQGNLTDWWTPESAKRFTEASAAIVKQFSGYVAIDDLHVNGELTQGENIADLGGVKIAYAALQKALAGKPATKIDGFTPEQRFFLSWATVWRTNMRDEALRLQVNTDPHSPAKLRVNGPLSNLEEFKKAFDVPEAGPMQRPAADRVAIW